MIRKLRDRFHKKPDQMEDEEICARHLYFDQGFVRLQSSSNQHEDLRITGGRAL